MEGTNRISLGTKICLVIIAILIIVLIFVSYIAIKKNEKVILSNDLDNSITNQEETNNTKTEIQNTSKSIEFNEFSELFQNTNKYDHIFLDSEYSYIDSIYIRKVFMQV